MKLDQIDKKILGLVEKVINISEETLKESGQLPPMLLTVESGGGEFIHRFVEGDMEALKLKAQQYIEKNAYKIDYCVLSYDGRVIINSSKNEAIIVIGYGKNEKCAYIFAERYLRERGGLQFEKDINFVDQDKNLLLP